MQKSIDVDALLGVTDVEAVKVELMRLRDGLTEPVKRVYTIAGVLGGVGGAIMLGGFAGKREVERQRQITRRCVLLGVVPLIAGGVFGAFGGTMHHRYLQDGGYDSGRGVISFYGGVGSIRGRVLMGHEYVHHVQKVMGFWYARGVKMTMAIEGMARGVEANLCRMWSERSGDEGCEYVSLSMRVKELKGAYEFMCRRLGVEVDGDVMKAVEGVRSYRFNGSERSLGYALFCCMEAERGEGMYREMLEGGYEF